MQVTRSSRPTFRNRIWQRFRQKKVALWSLRSLYVLLFVAIFSDFLANEKPIVCKIDGNWYFPVFRQYAVALGLAGWENRFVTTEWKDQPYQWAIFPPVPYAATTQDILNRGMVGPLDQQRIKSWRWRHWMGTDNLGRDVAAGVISGTRTAMLVGIVAMSIATILGILFGALAGYFGDDRFRVSRIWLLLNLPALGIAVLYGWVIPAGMTQVDLTTGLQLAGIAVGALLIANVLSSFLEKISFFRKELKIPVDMLVMRLVEIMESIPALLLLLAITAIIKKPSILYVMAIIGLIRWTNIAQFLRAELLRIRQLEYIEAARALGFGGWRIIFRHALPNAISPVLIVLSFGIASAILLEAFMSFLGIGVAAEEVTWGSLLSMARQNFSAWWLALFPGLAIFFTVTMFNLIGEGLTEALDVKGK